jgi:hypothetical protein
MSEPEIARRCAHCGVSLRQRALFCPQCGEKTGETHVQDTQILEPPSRDVQPHEDPSLTTPALTGVAGNVRGRVEKIKLVSSVVIDQAGYDPSLRFLLVAAALFVIFLLVLLLSKFIT